MSHDLALAFLRLDRAERAYDINIWVREPGLMEAQRAEYHAAWAHLFTVWDRDHL